MIPDNIKKSHVLEAIKLISKEGTPKERQATKYYLCQDGENFPPKYVLSIANRFANGRDLGPGEFSGGRESNGFLERLGFEIRPASPTSSRTKKSATATHATGVMKPKESKEEQESVEREITASGSDFPSVATVLIESDGSGVAPSDSAFNHRMKILEQVLAHVGHRSDVALLPGGFFSTYSEPRRLYSTIETTVSALLRNVPRLQFVCIGIDGREGEDQVAIVVSKSGVVAAGRKFHPAPGEAGFIRSFRSLGIDSANKLFV